MRVRMKASRGFSFVEAMVAVVIIGVVLGAVGYGAGLGGAALRAERTALERTCLIEAKLGELEATAYRDLVGGADTVLVADVPQVRRWTLTRFDGNGDTAADAGILLVTVAVDPDSMQTLRCDIP